MASRFRTRLVYWIFALFLIAVAGATGLWFVGASLVREQVAEIGAALAGEGGSFSVETVDISGFPFHYDARLGGIAVAGRDPRGTWEWRAERAALHLSPWLTRDVTFDVAGAHKLRLHLGRVPVSLELVSASAPGQIRAGSGGAPHLLEVKPVGLTARDASTGARLSAERGAFQLFLYPERKVGNTEPAAGMLVELAGVELPPEIGKYLGAKLTRLAAEGQVLAELPVPLNRQNVARWREAGGTVEVRSLALEWGPAQIEGSGTVTLDAGLQPEASFAARVSGFEETVDALVSAGLIRDQEAQSVKLLLSLMARRSSPGRAPEIRVPVTIQDRTIFVGPARLARMPPVRW